LALCTALKTISLTEHIRQNASDLFSHSGDRSDRATAWLLPAGVKPRLSFLALTWWGGEHNQKKKVKILGQFNRKAKEENNNNNTDKKNTQSKKHTVQFITARRPAHSEQ